MYRCVASSLEKKRSMDGKLLSLSNFQVIIGIGAKPAVGPFERVGLNTDVGGIQVRPVDKQIFCIMFKIRN